MIKTLVYSVIGAMLLTVQAYAVTAFQAVDLAKKQANSYARKSLVQIVGKPGTVGQMPEEWQILFFDPKAEQCGMMITVSGNVVTGIHDGYTQMDSGRIFAYKMEEIIDPAKLKIDSSRVMQILQNSPSLHNAKITSVGLWLKKDKKGPLAPPIWYVDLYASNVDGNKEVKFGTSKIDGETGKIIDLNVDLSKISK